MAKLSLARSERIAVLTTLNIRKDLDKIAVVQRKSLNSIINDAMTEFLNNHQRDIQRYDAFFGEE